MNGKILYKVVSAEIIKEIQQGKYRCGDFLPTQSELCKKYSVSLITLKNAIAHLESQGFVRRRQGRRTHVVSAVPVSGTEHSILLLDILGKNRETVMQMIPKKQRLKARVDMGWNSIIRHSIISSFSEETEVISASYYYDEITDHFEDTLLYRADRIAIFGGASVELAQMLRSKGKQVVLFGNYTAENICCVYNDDRAACAKAIKYLISQRHKRIAYIGSATSGGDFAERYKGYQDAMISAGLSLNGFLVRWCKHATADEGYSKMSDILYSSTLYGRPTAVFCADDNIAYGAIVAIKESQLRCPEDISVIGVNNYREICEEIQPTLSSIEKNFKLVGLKFAEILKREKWIDDGNIVKCDLVIRDSIQENKRGVASAPQIEI